MLFPKKLEQPLQGEAIEMPDCELTTQLSTVIFTLLSCLTFLSFPCPLLKLERSMLISFTGKSAHRIVKENLLQQTHTHARTHTHAHRHTHNHTRIVWCEKEK